MTAFDLGAEVRRPWARMRTIDPIPPFIFHERRVHGVHPTGLVLFGLIAMAGCRLPEDLLFTQVHARYRLLSG